MTSDQGVDWEALEPLPPPYYSGPELARIYEKAQKVEQEGLSPEEREWVEKETQRVAWGRAKYQRLHRPSRSMIDFARKEALAKIYNQRHPPRRDYG